MRVMNSSVFFIYYLRQEVSSPVILLIYYKVCADLLSGFPQSLVEGCVFYSSVNLDL